MEQRKSGRPSGTDGSDFSYRMVVDSRYTKVAKGKSRLSVLILTQAGLQLIGLLFIVLSISKEKGINRFAVSAPVVGLIAVRIGELGQRRSRVSFLRVYMVLSSIAMLLSLFFSVSSNSMLEFIQSPNDWESKKFEIIQTFLLLLGLLVQVFTISTVISLIGNMSPPKKAS